jgi:hypothetical protein
VSPSASAVNRRRRRPSLALQAALRRDVLQDARSSGVSVGPQQFVGVFRAPPYEEFSLSSWLTHAPPKLLAQRLNIDEQEIAKCPDNSPGLMPKR